MLFQSPPLTSTEQEVIERCDEIRQRLQFTLGQPHRWFGSLRKIIAARNIRGSVSIEGHNVSLDDAAAATDDGEPHTAHADDWRAVRGYRNALDYVIRLADDPHFRYDGALIRTLHYLLMKDDRPAGPGRYRTGPVYVQDTASGAIRYEGAPAEEVPALVDELAEDLNSEQGHALVRGAMAHLNLIMIHPFADGNGRMSRVLQTLTLARRQILSPVFSSIEEYLGNETPAYYQVLQEAGGAVWDPGRDSRPWIRFVLTAHLRQAEILERRTREAEELWGAMDEYRRAAGLEERTLDILYDAALDLTVRRADHVRYSGVSERVATGDLRRLTEAGLLTALGERRGRRYTAGPRLRELRSRTRQPRTALPDPFA